jgi:multisite-specific tRNA:(cytosine-C5)-methyltransferase/tRNA (cytosine34-C5)-methyltransferase
METLRRQLSVSFRITGSHSHYEEFSWFNDKNHFSKINSQEEIGNKPKEIKWYPNGLGWQIPISRTELNHSKLYLSINF